MGGHNFMSLFTLSMIYIELLVASSLSLTWMLYPFLSSHHLSFTLRWGPHDVYMHDMIRDFMSSRLDMYCDPLHSSLP